jgi:hypothetical protein
LIFKHLDDPQENSKQFTNQTERNFLKITSKQKKFYFEKAKKQVINRVRFSAKTHFDSSHAFGAAPKLSRYFERIVNEPSP